MTSIVIIGKVRASLDGTLTDVAAHTSEHFARLNPWMPTREPRSFRIVTVDLGSGHCRRKE